MPLYHRVSILLRPLNRTNIYWLFHNFHCSRAISSHLRQHYVSFNDWFDDILNKRIIWFSSSNRTYLRGAWNISCLSFAAIIRYNYSTKIRINRIRRDYWITCSTNPLLESATCARFRRSNFFNVFQRISRTVEGTGRNCWTSLIL